MKLEARNPKHETHVAELAVLVRYRAPSLATARDCAHHEDLPAPSRSPAGTSVGDQPGSVGDGMGFRISIFGFRVYS
ncbi:MAG: hypothetical protein AAB562_02455, partial [Patescibacteria group bacterium]